MAWNEPGNNNNDPWKPKKGNEQGPPDLDDLFKSMGDKLGGVFGGGNKGGTSGRSGGSAGNIGLGLIALLALVIWAISGFYTLREAERGVVLRFGKFYEIVEPGLHWKPTFIDRVIPVDVQTIRYMPSAGFMLTQDENVVRVEMEIQYRVVNPRNYLFSVTNADDSLRQALDSALRYVVGHSEMDQVLTKGREQVRQNTWDELEKIIQPYEMGIAIVDVNFKDARPPEEVKDAFDDAIAAQEDEERYIREAEAYAREIEPRARGRVERMEQEAQAYKQRVVLEAEGAVARFEKLLPEYLAAPDVTRERMYLETMEQVYGNTTKVLIDTQSGNNLIYLPLDKIMQQQSGQLTIPLRRDDVSSVREEARSSQPTGIRESRRSRRKGRD